METPKVPWQEISVITLPIPNRTIKYLQVGMGINNLGQLDEALSMGTDCGLSHLRERVIDALDAAKKENANVESKDD